GQEGAKLVPAPGDPWYATYTYDPLNAPFSTPPPAAVAGVGPMPDDTTVTGAQQPPPPPPGPPSPELQLAPMDGGGR
ncbi:MAG: MCE family protein, partial [Mycobacterium sp.]